MALTLPKKSVSRLFHQPITLRFVISISNWRGNIVKNRQPRVTKDTDELDEVHPNAKMRIGGFLALLAIYSLSLEFLGFVLSGVLALVASLILAGERRASIIIAMSLLLPISLFLFFYKVAYVPVPNGILAPFIRWI